MTLKHTEALITKSQTVPALASKTFTTRVPKGTDPPYLVWHPAQGTNTQERLTAPAATKHPRFTGHLVAEDGTQAQALADLLEAALFPGGRGAVTVSGESVKDFWYESPLPIQVSTDPLPEIVYAVIECGWTADPA